VIDELKDDRKPSINEAPGLWGISELHDGILETRATTDIFTTSDGIVFTVEGIKVTVIWHWGPNESGYTMEGDPMIRGLSFRQYPSEEANKSFRGVHVLNGRLATIKVAWLVWQSGSSQAVQPSQVYT